MPDTITPLYYVCFLKKFNNYFNRIIKGYATLAEYESAVGEGNFYLYSKAINYNPNDSVSTELIMNDCPFDPDYLLILDSNGDIVARWFVLESIFTRNGQRKFDIRRDVLYDYKDKLLRSPVFVQKGKLSDGDPFILNSEGMSFNEIKKSETLLKDKSQSAWIVGYIAKNTGGSTINVNIGAEDIMTATSLSDIASAMGVSVSDLSSVLNVGQERTNPSYFTSKVEVRYGWRDSLPIPYIKKIQQFFSGDFSSYLPLETLSPDVYSWAHPLFKTKTAGFVNLYDMLDIIGASIVSNKAAIVAQMPTITGRKFFTSSQLEILRSYDRKVVVYNGVYYKLEVNVGATKNEVFGPTAYTTYSAFTTAFNNAAANTYISNRADIQSGGEITIRPTSTEVYVNLLDASYEDEIPTLKTEINVNRAKMLTGVYDMFAIPFGRIFVRGTSQYFWTIPDVALRIAAGIAQELDASCYDIQLLPYCPRQEFIVDGEINIPNNATLGTDFDIVEAQNTIGEQTKGDEVASGGAPVNHTYKWAASVQDGSWPSNASDVVSISYTISGTTATIYDVSGPTYDNATHSISMTFETDIDISDSGYVNFTIKYRGDFKQSVILWCKENSFSVMLDDSSYKLSLKDSMKVESQCNKYRLCSPNYQGSFDFNVAKAGGSIDYFIAECTYKPFTPYIKVAPQFSYMYGANYGDARGLICGGEFSLPRITDAWESYQLQNKNYQNIFNREIQNLTIEQDLQMREQLISGGIGIATSGAIGAGVGAKVGGGWGALAGGIVGTAGGAAGLAVDADFLAKRQRETKQLAIDKFNYQLGNIKALPYTLTKVGAFDINSKIWPFVEYYTCSDEEKEALENKIKYESMTVMRIELLGTYFGAFSEPTYFKGELIRNEEIAEDNHVFEAIYSELVKGVYI